MNTNFLKLLCILIAILMLVPAVAIMVQADEDSDKSIDLNIRGKRVKPDSPPGQDKNKAPVVTTVQPTGTYVNGDTMTIEVLVEDEDDPAIATVSVDGNPIDYPGSSITYDISTWQPDIPHDITASYIDSGGKSDSASKTVIKGDPPVGDKYALLVGISDYHEINDLSFCDEDVTDWYNYLVGTLDYSPNNIVVLGDGHTNDYPKHNGLATRSRILAELSN